MGTQGALASILLLSCLLFAQAQSDNPGRMPPKLTEPLVAREEFVSVGKKVTLKCSATGIPNPGYVWYWNGDIVNSDNSKVTYDGTTGNLTITDISVNEEGFYNCRASVTFGDGSLTVVAISPKIEVRVSRVEGWNKPALRDWDATEHNYKVLPCENQPRYYGPTTFKWYTTDLAQKLEEIALDERQFIDAKGSLHFTYLKTTDELQDRYYTCAMSNAVEGNIRSGGLISLDVAPVSTDTDVAAVLQFHTGQQNSSELTVKRHTTARLECVFSGYSSSGSSKVPSITWWITNTDQISSEGRFSIENDGRVLVIDNVDEGDEKNYVCKGENSAGSHSGTLHLNVTSAPIFTHHLQSQTVPQGKDAEFNCETRSASGEIPPNPPTWYRNGLRLDNNTSFSKNKFHFHDGNRRLTIKAPQKDTDIACFQCYVSNSVGQVFSSACLNVILPITITEKPTEAQVVSVGDIVNLTVVATTDSLVTLTYKWTFNGVDYEGSNAPPYVQYDTVTQAAFINTTNFNDTQMQEIKGVYYRKLYHQYEEKVVLVNVSLANETVVVAVVAAGFDYWIIGLIIGILLIIIVIIIICCVICRRKMLEGAYPVDRKEVAAGLNPAQEMLDSGFGDLSRADYDYLPEKKEPNLDFDEIPMGDDDSFASDEYGDEDARFNEDGSFIGEYTKGKKPGGPPAYKAESNV